MNDTMYIISCALALVTTVLGIIEPFNKKMSAVLAFNLTGNVLVGINYPISGSLSFAGMAVCIVACVQVFINFLFARKNKTVPVWLLVVYLISFVAVNLLSFREWYDILALGAAVCFVFSISQQSTRSYRILYCINSSLWIVYDLLACSYTNLATHIALAVFTLVSMLVNDRNGKKKGEKSSSIESKISVDKDLRRNKR